MKRRSLNKKQYTKKLKKFMAERVKCESCKHYFQSFCYEHDTQRYKNETICYKYEESK